jgi:hypothetical protein
MCVTLAANYWTYVTGVTSGRLPVADPHTLAEMGFEVFWDQETPSGSDWNTWIRGELAKSKCAVAFWSTTSTISDNVRHEAVVAKE